MPRRSVLAVIAGGLLCLGLEGSASPQLSQGFLGAQRWTSDEDRFGGFSAIEMLTDTRFLALSDRGGWVEGRLSRDATGRITDVASGPVTLLKSTGEAPLRRARSDSEGLAVAPDGTVYVSFETAARVLRYDRIDGVATNLPVPEAFKAFQKNAGLEALAVAPDGTLYTLPERTGPAERRGFLSRYGGSDDATPFPVFRYRRGVWQQPFHLRREGSFVPVAADIGPDGRFYVLERAFHGLAGFASRVRSFGLTDRALTDERVVMQSGAGRHDNLEGLSVWRDGSGQIRLTMVADDNFIAFQQTQIVEYRLPD